jgi:hypothetical protein
LVVGCAFERESVILMSDGDDTAIITTHHRRVLTRLGRFGETPSETP